MATVPQDKPPHGPPRSRTDVSSLHFTPPKPLHWRFTRHDDDDDGDDNDDDDDDDDDKDDDDDDDNDDADGYYDDDDDDDGGVHSEFLSGVGDVVPDVAVPRKSMSSTVVPNVPCKSMSGAGVPDGAVPDVSLHAAGSGVDTVHPHKALTDG